MTIIREGANCEDCKRYLLCKKVKDLDKLPPLCKKFEDNFERYDKVMKEIEDEDASVLDEYDEVDDEEDERPAVMYKCTGATAKCQGCPHATPHDPFDEEEYLDGTCVEEYEECEDVEAKVKCIPV